MDEDKNKHLRSNSDRRVKHTAEGLKTCQTNQRVDVLNTDHKDVAAFRFRCFLIPVLDLCVLFRLSSASCPIPASASIFEVTEDLRFHLWTATSPYVHPPTRGTIVVCASFLETIATEAQREAIREIRRSISCAELKMVPTHSWL